MSKNGMSKQQQIAFDNPCLLAEETSLGIYAMRLPRGETVVLTINTGYE